MVAEPEYAETTAGTTAITAAAGGLIGGLEMSDIERTLDLAKRGKFSRSELYWRMQALADQQREPGQSQAQAFAKFVMGEGRELMMVHQSLSNAGSGGITDDYTAPPTSVPVEEGCELF